MWAPLGCTWCTRPCLPPPFTLWQRSQTLAVKLFANADILHRLHLWESSAWWLIAITTMEPDEGVEGVGLILAWSASHERPSNTTPTSLTPLPTVRSICHPVDLLAEPPFNFLPELRLHTGMDFSAASAPRRDRNSISRLLVKWQPSHRPSTHYSFRSSKWNFSSLVPIRETGASILKTRFERMVPL